MKNPLPSSRSAQKCLVLPAFLLLIFAILIYQAVEEGWFTTVEPFELNSEHTLLFFNRYKGCECELIVYRSAESQVQTWTDEARQGVPVITINLDRRRDLGAQFNIIRAPTLLLVDQNGQDIFRQDEGVIDTQPLNLLLFEVKIAEVLDAK